MMGYCEKCGVDNPGHTIECRKATARLEEIDIKALLKEWSHGIPVGTGKHAVIPMDEFCALMDYAIDLQRQVKVFKEHEGGAFWKAFWESNPK